MDTKISDQFASSNSPSEIDSISISEQYSSEQDRSLNEIELLPLELADGILFCNDSETITYSCHSSNASSVARRILNDILDHSCFESNGNPKNLNNVEICNPVAFETSGSELKLDSTIDFSDSYRDIRSNSLGTSSTDYKQLHEDCFKKLSSLQALLRSKDELLTKLSNSLEHSNQKLEAQEQYSQTLRNDLDTLQEKLQNFQAQVTDNLHTDNTICEQSSPSNAEFDAEIQSYELRLEQQVNLAKIEIMSTMECHIHALVNGTEDILNANVWPSKLLPLKQKFDSMYENKIRDYEVKLQELQRQISEIHNARDSSQPNYYKVACVGTEDQRMCCVEALNLRNIISKLLRYFHDCENELNQTLINELVSNDVDLNVTKDGSVDEIVTEVFKNDIKAIHLAPPDLEILLNTSKSNDSVEQSHRCNGLITVDSGKNVISTLDENLERQLQLLRSEANSILQLSNKWKETHQQNSILLEELSGCRTYVKELERQHKEHRNSLERSFSSLIRISPVCFDEEVLDNHQDLLSHLHLQVRSVLAQFGSNGKKKNLNDLSDVGMVLSLLEKLVSVGENLIEDIKRERDDFFGQIEVADKKYKQTNNFLEEQAAEREQERDEAQKQINTMREQLKERDKDRLNAQRLLTEVNRLDLLQFPALLIRLEHAEQQNQELTNCIQQHGKKVQEIEAERDEAVAKIADLRDIIRDLELQLDQQTKEHLNLTAAIQELELQLRPSSSRSDGHCNDIADLRDYISNLERELQQFKDQSEFEGHDEALKQIKNHLCEFEFSIDNKTKHLEGLHSTNPNTSCSSPSEDMSVRDVVSNQHNLHANKEVCVGENEIPLQQLSRLKEKLIRHSRAEDAAVKRVRDLEMQLLNFRVECEEHQAEKELLKKQLADQVVLISSLQIRLDDQRMRAEHIEKETNAGLEARIHDLEQTIADLNQKLCIKDRNINQLNCTVQECQQRLIDAERSLSSDQMIIDMQKKIDFLNDENVSLKTKINEHTFLPTVMQGILDDKNRDIELLKEQVNDYQEKLQMFHGLNFNKSQLEKLKHIQTEGISFLDLFNVDGVQRDFHVDRTLQNSNAIHQSKIDHHEREPCTFLQELSTIENPNSVSMSETIGGKKNSTEISGKLGKHVHFDSKLVEDVECIAEIEKLRAQSAKMTNLEEDIQKLQKDLKEAELQLVAANAQHDKDIKAARNSEQNALIELVSMKLELKDYEEKLQKCMSELHTLTEFKNSRTNMECTVDSLQKNITELELKLQTYEIEKKQLVQELKSLQSKNLQLLDAETKLEEMFSDIQKYEDQMRNYQNEIGKLQALCTEKDLLLVELKPRVMHLDKEINHLNMLLVEKDKVISQMSQDSKSLHINLETIQNRLKGYGSILDLGKKLKEEQKRNKELILEVHQLKAQILDGGCQAPKRYSIDDIANRLQIELDLSTYLDSNLISAAMQDPLLLQTDRQQLSDRNSVKNGGKLSLSAEQLQTKCDQLTALLKKQKEHLEAVQIEDGNLMEQLTKQLEDKNKGITEIADRLQLEQQMRIDLEKQVRDLIPKSLKMHSKSIQCKLLETSRIRSENDKQKKEVYTLRLEKEDAVRKIGNLEVELKFAQELANSKTSRLEDLEMLFCDMEKKKNLLKLEVKQLKSELLDKRERVEAMNALLHETDRQRLLLRQRNDQLQGAITKSLANDCYHNSSISGKQHVDIMDKIAQLKEEIQNNQEMYELMQNMNAEKQQLEAKVRMLEAAANDSYAVSNTYAMYLRANSYRKSLVWQKRFITAVLLSLNGFGAYEVYVRLGSTQPKKRHRSFRVIAWILIWVHRTKKHVVRWHSGRRLIRTTDSLQSNCLQFRVGQPVNSENFTIPITSNVVPVAMVNVQDMREVPWSGVSPPSKDPGSRLRFSTSKPDAASSLFAKSSRRPQNYYSDTD